MQFNKLWAILGFSVDVSWDLWRGGAEPWVGSKAVFLSDRRWSRSRSLRKKAQPHGGSASHSLA